LPAAAKDYMPSQGISGASKVCVERYEDNGAPNTWLPLSFDNQIEETLAAEERYVST